MSSDSQSTQAPEHDRELPPNNYAAYEAARELRRERRKKRSRFGLTPRGAFVLSAIPGVAGILFAVYNQVVRTVAEHHMLYMLLALIPAAITLIYNERSSFAREPKSREYKLGRSSLSLAEGVFLFSLLVVAGFVFIYFGI
ncbi:MAG: hypothetical protein GVY18_00960 [Bacteroidetes bacterium]|jgi:hypothetical protein|nr:hypothetical protein [Bacteroidota bacterium]